MCLNNPLVGHVHVCMALGFSIFFGVAPRKLLLFRFCLVGRRNGSSWLGAGIWDK